jgi:hypothetical protein
MVIAMLPMNIDIKGTIILSNTIAAPIPGMTLPYSKVPSSIVAVLIFSNNPEPLMAKPPIINIKPGTRKIRRIIGYLLTMLNASLMMVLTDILSLA